MRSDHDDTTEHDSRRPRDPRARRRRAVVTAAILFAAALVIYLVFIASGVLRAGT